MWDNRRVPPDEMLSMPALAPVLFTSFRTTYESIGIITLQPRKATTKRIVGEVDGAKVVFTGFLVHYSQVIHKRLWRLRRCGLTLLSGLRANKKKGG